MSDRNEIGLGEMNPHLASAVEKARLKIKDHFRKRAAEAAQSVVNDWKAEKIWACRKLLGGLQIGLGRSRFYALLTSESPKQNPSSRFCSWTVQAPTKPNPLRSHSMASNPWMDRRAVLKL